MDHLLHVATKEPVLRLVQQARIVREPVGGLYLYCSADPGRRQSQLEARLRLQTEPRLAGSLAEQETVPDEVKAAIVRFLSTLDERQRRLYAGLESLKLGYGGDQRIADFIGMDARTVGKSRRQLLDQDLDLERIGQAAAGA